MEKVIYGPKGGVARRIVAAGGPSQSTVYKDMDSRKTLVSTVTDAEPALRLAHQARVEGNQTGETGRLMGYMPENEYFAMVRRAKRESKATGGGYAEILRRMQRQYFQENPYLAT